MCIRDSSITTKMNQGSSQSLMNSTRMIQSSISSELENDMEQIESSASLFVMSGGEKDAAKTLANYAAATEFFRFYYICLLYTSHHVERGVREENGSHP